MLLQAVQRLGYPAESLPYRDGGHLEWEERLSRHPQGMMKQLLEAYDDEARWATVAEEVRTSVAEVLGTYGTVSLDAPARALRAEWTGGPSVAAVSQVVNEKLNKGSNYWQEEGEAQVIAWPGLGLYATRTIPRVANGYAALAGLVAAGCPRCAGRGDYDADEVYTTTYEALVRKDRAEELGSHPGLVYLTALGLERERIVRLAELLGALSENGGRREILEAACRAGHLPGLLAIEAAVTA